MERIIGSARLRLKKGDLILEETDAIVNAANPSLLGGGGVDGAIHQAGGPAILEDCKRIRSSRGPLPTGEAVITTGGRLRAGHVIHTVGPVWSGGLEGEDVLLRKCYRNCLALAVKNDLRSVAFPSLSTGTYGYPVEKAAVEAMRSVTDFLKNLDGSDDGRGTLREVVFVLFTDRDMEEYARALEGIDFD